MNKVNMDRYERMAAEAKFMGKPMPPSKHGQRTDKQN